MGGEGLWSKGEFPVPVAQILSPHLTEGCLWAALGTVPPPGVGPPSPQPRLHLRGPCQSPAGRALLHTAAWGSPAHHFPPGLAGAGSAALCLSWPGVPLSVGSGLLFEVGPPWAVLPGPRVPSCRLRRAALEPARRACMPLEATVAGGG